MKENEENYEACVVALQVLNDGLLDLTTRGYQRSGSGSSSSEAGKSDEGAEISESGVNIRGAGDEGSSNTKLSSRIEGNSYDINKLQKTQPYTYPENVDSIKQTIAQNGPNAVPPIEIRVDNGQVLVVDGHHRLEAFRQLGYDRVPIKYLHSSQLGKVLSDGTYYRSLEELLTAAKLSN